MSSTAGPGDERYGFRTRAVHAGGRPDPTTGARAVPIYQTTSFVFEDALDASTLFALQKYGNIYSRIANPTVAAFEERMASLEGGLGAVGDLQRAGRRAPRRSIALAGAGDHIVAIVPALRRHPDAARRDAAPLRRRDHVRGRRRPRRTSPPRCRRETKAIYTEVIGNPSGAIADLAGLADVAHAHGVPARRRRHPGHARTSAGRSSTAPTSSSTRRPSSSAATARRSAASSSSPAASTGPTAASR